MRESRKAVWLSTGHCVEPFKLLKVKFGSWFYKLFCTEKKKKKKNARRVATSDHKMADSDYEGRTCLYYSETATEMLVEGIHWISLIWTLVQRLQIFRFRGLLLQKWFFSQSQLAAAKNYYFSDSLCLCSKERLYQLV